MKNMLNSLTVRDFLGPIMQFFTNLLGKNSDEWWTTFKKYLRKEMVTFSYDMYFDPGKMLKAQKPKLWILRQDLGPAKIRRLLANQNLRMASELELLSFMASEVRGWKISAMIFSYYGPNQVPCVLRFCKNKWGEFEMGILNNQDTAIWKAGCGFLVFPECDQKTASPLVTDWRDLPQGKEALGSADSDCKDCD